MKKVLFLVIFISCNLNFLDTSSALVTDFSNPATYPQNFALQLTVLDSARLQKIYNQLAFESNLPFAFPERGCEARAHAMALMLKQQNIEAAKIFTTGYLKVLTSNTPSGFVVWQFHVAITVRVQDSPDQPIETYVIDPSLFERPVKIGEWVALQMSQPDNRLDNLVQTPTSVYELIFQNIHAPLSHKTPNIRKMKSDLRIFMQAQKQRQQQ